MGWWPKFRFSTLLSVVDLNVAETEPTYGPRLVQISVRRRFSNRALFENLRLTLICTSLGPYVGFVSATLNRLLTALQTRVEK